MCYFQSNRMNIPQMNRYGIIDKSIHENRSVCTVVRNKMEEINVLAE